MRLACILPILLAVPAHAQTPCMGRADATAMLYEHYGESPVHSGITAEGAELVIFVNPITRAFTLTLAIGNQLCRVDSGTNWTTTAPLPVGEPA